MSMSSHVNTDHVTNGQNINTWEASFFPDAGLVD